ncbi:hypothetical protein BDZ97DRAFT_1165926 [Flammula alnicola]|nr:hypothetical protein BDZ97DRAFT_1165926 [Flammula alnicola]
MFNYSYFCFVDRAGRLGMAHRWFNVSSDRYWASKILAVTLSKASPASRLAEILRDNALRFETSSVPAQDPNSYLYKNILPELALASLVYIKECNIPFREHSHNPKMTFATCACRKNGRTSCLSSLLPSESRRSSQQHQGRFSLFSYLLGSPDCSKC